MGNLHSRYVLIDDLLDKIYLWSQESKRSWPSHCLQGAICMHYMADPSYKAI